MGHGPGVGSGISQLSSVACASFTDGPMNNLQCAYREKSCFLVGACPSNIESGARRSGVRAFWKVS